MSEKNNQCLKKNFERTSESLENYCSRPFLIMTITSGSLEIKRKETRSGSRLHSTIYALHAVLKIISLLCDLFFNTVTLY